MVDKEQTAGLGASDDTNGNSTARGDFSSELLFAKRVFLPFGLIGAFAVTDGYEGPRIRELIKLAKKIGQGPEREARAYWSNRPT